MLRTTLVAGTLIALVATPALADCKEEFGDLRETMKTVTLTPAMRYDLNQLRSAARTLVRYDKAETCETVIATIEDIIERRLEKREAQRERAAELKRFQTAKTVEDIAGVVRVDTIRGLDVFNLQGEELGAVEGVTVDADKGEIAYVVLSHGGFLGIGEKLIAVPWNSFRMTEERDALVLDVQEKTLADAPGFDEDNWPDMSDPNWRGSVKAFFNRQNRG